jgi:hypothetical protein
VLKEAPLFSMRSETGKVTNNHVVAVLRKLPERIVGPISLLRDNGDWQFRNSLHLFFENSFELVTDAEKRACSKLTVRGLFILLPRFNHSCLPNARISMTDEASRTMKIFASKTILDGDEITLEVRPELECLTKEERRQQLGFACRCMLCQSRVTATQLSDSRRRLIRGLLYLLFGEDLQGKAEIAATRPVIADCKLRRAAETFNIPLCSRFVYGLTLAVLLEEEGLLGYRRLAKVLRLIHQPILMFRTPRIQRLAKQAIAQATWLERLNKGFQLFGQPDAADSNSVQPLRASFTRNRHSPRLG